MKALVRSGLALAASVALVIACGGKAEPTTSASSSSGSSSSSSSSSASGGPAPGVESLTTCDGPGACELAAPGCCGITCQPDSELIAIRRGTAGDLLKATCASTEPVPCPACAREPSGPIQAFCQKGRCGVVDIGNHPVSACLKDEDCVLRYASCCQPCDGGSVRHLIAVSKGSVDVVTSQLCAESQACDACLPAFPANVTAFCNFDKNAHCDVRLP